MTMQENQQIVPANDSKIVIYQTDDGRTNIDVKFEDDTVWLSQLQLCDLYQSSKANINEHIKHIFEEGELDEVSVVRKFRTTGADGKQYQVKHYNLDMIISLGYRVKSIIATQFRRWATERLNEYIRKGFTIDDNRLKQAVGVATTGMSCSTESSPRQAKRCSPTLAASRTNRLWTRPLPNTASTR